MRQHYHSFMHLHSIPDTVNISETIEWNSFLYQTCQASINSISLKRKRLDKKKIQTHSQYSSINFPKLIPCANLIRTFDLIRLYPQLEPSQLLSYICVCEKISREWTLNTTYNLYFLIFVVRCLPFNPGWFFVIYGKSHSARSVALLPSSWRL